jgi:ABC-type antimicrobial peptide transport system permease subunit
VRFSDTISFSLRLILAKRKEYFLVFLGIFLGTASLFFFFSLTEGVKTGILSTIEDRVSEDSIIIRHVPSSSLFQTRLTEEMRADILKIDGVKSVAREISVSIPTTASVKYMGLTFPTDTFVKGADPEFFRDVAFENESFSVQEGKPLPLIISPLIIDIFNVGIADALPGISRIDPNDIVGITADLTFGKYIFLSPLSKEKNIQKEGVIVGISQRASPIGISIPLEEAFSLLREFKPSFSERDAEYSKFLVSIDNPSDYFPVKKAIEDIGLDLSYDAAQKERIEGTNASLILLQGVFIFSSLIILFIAVLFLFAMMSISVLEHRKTIGILRAIGASRSTILQIFLFEGVFVTSIAALSGIIFGWLISTMTNVFLLKSLPELSFLPENIFLFTPSIPLLIFFGVLFFTSIAMFFPAYKASKLTPLEVILD